MYFNLTLDYIFIIFQTNAIQNGDIFGNLDALTNEEEKEKISENSSSPTLSSEDDKSLDRVPHNRFPYKNGLKQPFYQNGDNMYEKQGLLDNLISKVIEEPTSDQLGLAHLQKSASK